MGKLHLLAKVKINFFMMAFENINMYNKGNYRVKVQSTSNGEKCQLHGVSKLNRESELGKKDGEQYFTKEFIIRYQNQKVELNELITIETPVFKYNRQHKILLKFTLLKAQSSQFQEHMTQYTPLRVSYGILRFVLNPFCQNVQCCFQEPFLSVLSGLMFAQPVFVEADGKEYRQGDGQSLLLLKKQVKKLRYNSYLLFNKYKKVFYGSLRIEFTLPRLFIDGKSSMQEMPTSQQTFLSYLINYETTDLTIEMMNAQLLSICKTHEQLFRLFRQNCQKDTIYSNKLRTEYNQKEIKRLKMHIAKEEYKQHFYEQYQSVLKEKMRVIYKQKQIWSQDQIMHNVMFKMENSYEETKPADVPDYPVILHQTQIKKESIIEAEDKDAKIRYILVLAHGYQGSPDDLMFFANGFKKKFRKSKYLILKSYRNKMGETIQAMAEGAVQEIDRYLEDLDVGSKVYRVVMVGHSMGGLILRLAANLIKQKELLYGYVSLGTAHLGYLQGLKLHIRAGLSFFSSVHSNPCLNQLSGKDSQQLHESAIYKMSQQGPLSLFKKIVLVSSAKDKYVPWHSARIQNFNKDTLKKMTFIENEMVSNILGKEGSIQRIDRLQVYFKLNESSSMDKIIGRTCHIKLLTDLAFIDLVCNHCLPTIFDS